MKKRFDEVSGTFDNVKRLAEDLKIQASEKGKREIGDKVDDVWKQLEKVCGSLLYVVCERK